MRRIRTLLISITIIAVFTVRLYARNEWKLLTGLGLTALGTYLTVDGFKEVIINEWDEMVIGEEPEITDEGWCEDISNPKLDISNWSWYQDLAITWWANPSGVVENTGNVPLKYVRIRYSFYDAFYNFIGSGYTYLDTCWDLLAVGQSDSWWGIKDCGYKQPWYGTIEVMDYDYDKLYHVHHIEKGPKSEAEGWCGVASAGLGIYFLVDYFTETPRVAAFLDRNDLDIKVVNRPGSLTLLATKAL